MVAFSGDVSRRESTNFQLQKFTTALQWPYFVFTKKKAPATGTVGHLSQISI